MFLERPSVTIEPRALKGYDTPQRISLPRFEELLVSALRWRDILIRW